MEYMIQEEARKILEKDLKKAKLQRQLQVRQQAIQWSEETRRRYEEEKERQIKLRSEAYAIEAQQNVQLKIDHLAILHDLEMEEMGSAHRAAAHLRQAESSKELKRLQHQEVAKVRGKAALGKTLAEKESSSQILEKVRKRKDDVRKEEDRKVREMLEEQKKRKPLATISNSTTNIQQTPSKSKFPSKMNQTHASKLNYLGKKMSTKIDKGPSPLKKKTPSKPTVPSILKPPSPPFGSKVSGRFDREAQQRVGKPSMKRVAASKQDDSSVKVQLPSNSTRSPMKPHLDKLKSPHPPKRSLLDKTKSAGSLTRVEFGVSTTRYYDSGLPIGEVNYVPPPGLAHMEEPLPSGSLNAWDKADQVSSKAMKELEEKAKRQEELLNKASVRGELAMKKAHLEKQLKVLKSELLLDTPEISMMGSGNQIGGLGLEDSHPKKKELKKSTTGKKIKTQSKAELLGDFSEMSSDGEFAGSSSDEGKSLIRLINKSMAGEKSKPKTRDVDDAKIHTISSEKSQIIEKSSPTKPIAKPGAPSLKSQQTYKEAMEILDTGLSQLKNNQAAAQELPVTLALKKLDHLQKHQAEASTLSDDQKISDKSSSSSGVILIESPNNITKHIVPPGKSKDIKTKVVISTSKLKLKTQTLTLSSGPPKHHPISTSTPEQSEAGQNKSTSSSSSSGSTIAEANIKANIYEYSSTPKTSLEEGSSEISSIKKFYGQNIIHPPLVFAPKVPQQQQKRLTKKMPKKLQLKRDESSTFSEVSTTGTSTSGTPISNRKSPSSVDSTPDGPYTSTPDGKLKLKKGIHDSATSGGSVYSKDGDKIQINPSKKELILHNVISEFLNRRRESIDLLPVSSSDSAGELKIDSLLDVSRSPSSSSAFTGSSTSNNKSHSTATSSSGTSKTWDTIMEERTIIEDNSIVEKIRKNKNNDLLKITQLSTEEDSSRSTIAETNIITQLDEDIRILFPKGHTSVVSSNGSGQSSLPDETQEEISSATTGNSGTSGENASVSITTTGTANNTTSNSHKDQNITVASSGRGHPNSSAIAPPPLSSPNTSSVVETLDISAMIKAVKNRNIEPEEPVTTRTGTETSSSGNNPQSGEDDVITSSDNADEKEIRRVKDFVGDLSDCGDIWDSPPGHGSKIHEEIVMSVFKQLKEDLNGMDIERPPWLL